MNKESNMYYLIENNMSMENLDNSKEDIIINTDILAFDNMSQNKPPTSKILISKNKKLCGCYNRRSNDMRCCGLCYNMCPYSTVESRYYCCHVGIKSYCDSSLVITIDDMNNDNDFCCTILCLPIKIPMFFPCCICSFVNSIINCSRGTSSNYLF